jgi:hypothetical protein
MVLSLQYVLFYVLASNGLDANKERILRYGVPYGKNIFKNIIGFRPLFLNNES